MSSILRALKKVEKNSQGKNAVRPWQREAGVPGVFNRTGRGRRRPKTAFYLLLGVIFLFIGGWLLLKVGPLLTKDRPLPASSLRQTKMRTKNGPTRVNKDRARARLKPADRQAPTIAGPGRRTNSGNRKTVTASRRAITVPAKRVKKIPAQVKKTAVKSQAKPMAGRPRAAPAATLNAGFPSGKTVIAPRKGPTPLGTDQKAAPRNLKARNVVRPGQPIMGGNKEASGFEVQAIAWSPAPEKRIAVINSKVVHEGDSVAGARVAQIGLDDVSLKIGDQTFRLRCWQ